MKNNSSSIGQWLKSKRLEQDWDTHQLARMAGIGQSQVSRVETDTALPTLNALISLSWALGINSEEVAAQTNTPQVIARKPVIRDKTALSGRFFSYDLEALFFKYFPRQDEKLFAFLTLFFREAYFSASNGRKVDFDDVQKQVRHAVVLSQKIPLPKKMPLDFFWDCYLDNGVLNLDDAAAYLVQSRMEAKFTLEKLNKSAGIAQSIISRIEQGQTERLAFDDIAKLDAVLKADGKIFSMFWHALEFQMGISRNRFFVYGAGMSPFAWQSYPLADVFVKLARWTEFYSSLGWLETLRADVDDYYKNLPDLAPVDYIENYNPARLSAKAFDYLRLCLPHLLLDSATGEDVLGGRFVIDESVLSLWGIVENQVKQHHLGPDMLDLLRKHFDQEEYQGMFKAVLRERLQQDESFSEELMDVLDVLSPVPPAPTWIPGKRTIEE